MTVSACGAVSAGFVGWLLASRDIVQLAGPLAAEVPPPQHVAFLIDGFAHTASYGFGFVGGLVVMACVWWDRARLPSPAPPR
jgi:hypothetical protein